jgi:hypothetical protein
MQKCIEPRLYIGALYTNYYTNELRKHHVQPVYGFSLHIRQHARVKIEGSIYPGVSEHLTKAIHPHISPKKATRGQVEKIYNEPFTKN